MIEKMKQGLVRGSVFLIAGLLLTGIVSCGFYGKPITKSKQLQFGVQTDVAYQELNKKFCWFHPRAAAIPGFGKNGKPA